MRNPTSWDGAHLGFSVHYKIQHFVGKKEVAGFGALIDVW